MIVILKYFYENTDTTYDEYNKLLDENIEKMIFLHHNLPLSKQMSSIIHDITDNKDILAIRFPTYKTIKQSNIINNIISGKGFIYTDNKIWFPKEVWIYSSGV
jgi:polyphosphate kinase